MRRTTTRLAAALLAASLAVAGGACSDGKAAGADPASWTTDEFLAELAAAGMPATEVTAIEGAALGGGTCKKGAVTGLDVTVCSYPDDVAARAAQPKGLAQVGDATGAALSRGHLLLVVTDRGKTDPSGKRINRVTMTFLQKPLEPAK